MLLLCRKLNQKIEKQRWLPKKKKNKSIDSSFFDTKRDYFKKSLGGSYANIQWFDTIHVDGSFFDYPISHEETYKK